MTKYNYNFCRAVGHTWNVVHRKNDSTTFGVIVEFMCPNCTTVRRDVISRYNGGLLLRNYTYPEDYHTESKGNSKSEFRLDWIKETRPRKSKSEKA